MQHYLQARTFAVEPSPRLFSVLEENISINGHPNIIPINHAIWDTNSVISLSNKLNTLNCVVSAEEKGAVSVRACTLDLFIREKKLNPGLIKIMTNWGESMILKSGLASIQKYRPILLISLSSSGKELFATLNICSQLKDYNFKITKCAELHATDGLFLICIPSESILV